LKPFYRIAICCLFLFVGNLCIGQHTNLGAWNIISFKLNLNRNWSIFEESQVRSQLFYDNFSYYEVKGGASYSFKKRFSVLAGFGRFMSYSDGDNFKLPYVNKEWRLWEQFLVNNYLGRVKFENRVRIEQRWTTNPGYRNRFKYRLNMVLPITNKKIIPGTLYFSGWDEIYLTNSNPNFEQTRVFAGLGYQISSHLTLQSGYLSQVSYKPDDTHSGKNYLQFTILVEANAHKEHHEKTPSSVD
jgi:Protein of unknown function (DUF2490)